MKFIKIFLVMLLFNSCKKTEVNGVVYSKHHIPIAGAIVTVNYIMPQSNFDKPEGTVATADNNGNFSLSFKSKRNLTYIIRCKNDSGSGWENIKKKQSNLVEINLY